jgi:glutathione S-transferase
VGELEPRLVERGGAALRRMDEALAGASFLVGERASLADVALVAYTREAGDGGFALSDYPHVQAWIGRVESALNIAP